MNDLPIVRHLRKHGASTLSELQEDFPTPDLREMLDYLEEKGEVERLGLSPERWIVAEKYTNQTRALFYCDCGARFYEISVDANTTRNDLIDFRWDCPECGKECLRPSVFIEPEAKARGGEQ